MLIAFRAQRSVFISVVAAIPGVGPVVRSRRVEQLRQFGRHGRIRLL